MRMEKVMGRIDDMLIIRGQRFPSQIEEVLASVEEVGPTTRSWSRARVPRPHAGQVELNDSSLLERFSHLEGLENRIRQRIRTILGLDVSVRLVEHQSLKRFEGKARRVTDLRKL